MLAVVFLVAVVVLAGIIGRLLRRVALAIALVFGVLIAFVADALGRDGFEVIAMASLPLLGVAIAASVRGTARGIREIRSERSPEQRQAALRQRHQRRQQVGPRHQSETDLAA